MQATGKPEKTRYKVKVESEYEIKVLNKTERGKLLYEYDGIWGDWGGEL